MTEKLPQPKTTHTYSLQGPELVLQEMKDGEWEWVVYGPVEAGDAIELALYPEKVRYWSYLWGVN